MYPKFNFHCYYDQMNHLYAPKYFDWVKDESGKINFWVDDFILHKAEKMPGKIDVAMLIEPRTIQPIVYEYLEKHHNDFNIIFSHDEKILELPNSYPIYFMNWYKTYDVPKRKAISMVCSDKVMCDEHRQRQHLADLLGNKIDHYGLYKGGYKCDYYECRAEYMFEIVVDNNWSGYWLSEKLANPLASKTIPIYLGGKHFPDDIDTDGIISVSSIDEIPAIVDRILLDPGKEYWSRIKAVHHNYYAIQNYHVFEDWLFSQYKDLFADSIGPSIISNNCMAGAILHDCGYKYLSPTISLQMMPEEYSKFCKNINEYMKLGLKEYKYEDLTDFHKQCLMRLYDGELPNYPLAKCGDLLVCLRHYDNFEHGYQKWEARRKRFNPLCTGFIFYAYEDQYKKEIDEFIKLGLSNSLVLTENFDIDISIEHYKIETSRPNGFLDYDENGERYYAHTFDAADWIQRVENTLNT